ncbi:FliM/FliN family flagellar motor switch protein [Vibrio mediterranei]|uniref:FliM/FliN family flagellar motor switch protein n=1 Tax=Vibrio mediterranei TaxID=689 RepID=UPI00406906B7
MSTDNELSLNLGDDLDLGLESELNLSDSEGKVGSGLNNLRNINVNLTAELGMTQMTLGDAEDLKVGSLVMLNKIEGDLADIRINGNSFGKGQIVEDAGRFGIKVISIDQK